MLDQLSPENESFIQQAIANGEFATRDEALETGISVDESRRQLDEGDYIEYDDQSLRSFFNDLKVRIRNSTSAGSSD